jgi:hypothetical protein
MAEACRPEGLGTEADHPRRRLDLRHIELGRFPRTKGQARDEGTICRCRHPCRVNLP